ncbi:MAG: hypothetical protein HY763_09120 [Planctomycetes bacterium]|nr:hypothetical protein [Planctomycetota bacterium]
MGKVLLPFKGGGQTVQFGMIDTDDEPVSRTIALQRGDGGPIHPEVAGTLPAGVTAEIKEVTAGEHYDLAVTVDPKQTTGNLYAALQVKTWLAELPTETVTVLGSRAPRVQIVPPYFQVPPGSETPWELKAKVVWSKATPRKVLSAEAAQTDLSVRVEEEGSEQVVVLSGPAGYKPAATGTSVTLHTDDTPNSTLTIPIVAGGKTRTVNRNPGAKAAIAAPGAAATAAPVPAKKNCGN